MTRIVSDPVGVVVSRGTAEGYADTEPDDSEFHFTLTRHPWARPALPTLDLAVLLTPFLPLYLP